MKKEVVALKRGRYHNNGLPVKYGKQQFRGILIDDTDDVFSIELTDGIVVSFKKDHGFIWKMKGYEITPRFESVE